MKINKNKNAPFFSVIIPTLNEEKYLPRLLNDLTKQTFKDFEVIIVDAKSEDKTCEKARKFRKKFINFQITKSKIKNVAHQRNKGANNAKADNIIFLDADVQVPNHFLQGVKSQHDSLNSDILSCWATPDAKGTIKIISTTLMNIYGHIQKKTANPYLLEAMILITKKAFTQLKGFDVSFHNGEGSDLLKRALAKNMKFDFIREPKFILSFRRAEKQGYLKTLRGGFELEFKRLFNKPVSFERAEKLYPMEKGLR